MEYGCKQQKQKQIFSTFPLSFESVKATVSLSITELCFYDWINVRCDFFNTYGMEWMKNFKWFRMNEMKFIMFICWFFQVEAWRKWIWWIYEFSQSSFFSHTDCEYIQSVIWYQKLKWMLFAIRVCFWRSSWKGFEIEYWREVLSLKRWKVSPSFTL